MSNDVYYGIPDNRDDLAALSDILSRSFAAPADVAAKRAGQFGIDICRVVREQGRVTGGLWLLDMGQWFGGRSVPAVGVSAVGVSPEYRGAGTALHLMSEAMRECHERGISLSSLYPAAQTLYRMVGFEQAGGRFMIRLPAKSIGMRERDLPMRPAEEADLPAIKEAYRRYASRLAGQLDRAAYHWHWVLQGKTDEYKGYVVEEDGRITGYCFLVQSKEGAVGFYDVHLSDLVALTPAAGRRILTFLADHRSMAGEIVWYGGPADPVLGLLREQSYRMELSMFWMDRVTHVPHALEARGYAPGVRAEIHLDVHDEIIPANHGRFVLEVADGMGKVRPGGNGGLRVQVRGLAAMYTGFLSPRGVMSMDLAEGDDAALAGAASAFAGPTPWMIDMF